jgi:hypothetical protein
MQGTQIFRVAVALAVAGLLAGCEAAKVERTVTTEFGAADPDVQLEFWHTLAEQPVTSNDDAFHGLLLYLDGNDESAGYDDRVATLKSRGLLPKNFNGPADGAVDRGTLSVAIAKLLNVRGGLVMNLTGPNARYATRELVFLGVYPPSSPNQTFSGSEYLGIIGKLEDYQRGEDPEADAFEGGPAGAGPGNEGVTDEGMPVEEVPAEEAPAEEQGAR